MAELSYRLLVLVWFVAYLSAIYLALHIMVARFSRKPGSRLLWFFSVVTSPLTWPVRAVFGPHFPEPRARLVAFGGYVVLWIVARVLLDRMGGIRLR